MREIFRIIRQLNENGTTILLVEQNAQLALQTAARGYVMEAGTITIAGLAQDLLHEARVMKAYLGENTLRATIPI